MKTRDISIIALVFGIIASWNKFWENLNNIIEGIEVWWSGLETLAQVIVIIILIYIIKRYWKEKKS